MNELIKDLQKLKDFWDNYSKLENPTLDGNISEEFSEDLDIIIKKYQEIYSDMEQFQK